MAARRPAPTALSDASVLIVIEDSGRSLAFPWRLLSRGSGRGDGVVVALAHGARGEVALAQLLVLVGGALRIARRRAVEALLLARGHARGEHAGADRAAVGDDGARGEDRARADVRVVEDDRAHPDHRALVDDAAFEQRVVADRRAPADDRRMVAVAVHDRAVLDRDLLADLDVRDVAAQDGAEPDARAVADADVAGEDRVRRQEDVAPDRGRDAVDLDQHRHLVRLYDAGRLSNVKR